MEYEEIEERARKAVPDMLRINDNYVASFVSGYCRGAREQHKIDAEELVRWLDKVVGMKCSSQTFVDFRKAMENN